MSTGEDVNKESEVESRKSERRKLHTQTTRVEGANHVRCEERSYINGGQEASVAES